VSVTPPQLVVRANIARLVSGDVRLFLLSAQGQQVTVNVPAGTTILNLLGQPMALSEIKPGNTVDMTATFNGLVYQASKITVFTR